MNIRVFEKELGINRKVKVSKLCKFNLPEIVNFTTKVPLKCYLKITNFILYK